ncbi:hypothetical protein F4776DRAFT_245400 [Hypoxylon sp. NC0597]|nr:hypothetical protein F4776DRAFT_245400 [Hypoxylon sp. NC0597]
MTNLGPLTTIYTPSGSDCTSTFIGLNYDNKWIQYGVGGAASSACLPPNFIPYEPYYYSPGICPSGYTSACQAQSSPSTGTVSATTATCCPIEYSCRDNRSDDPFGCWSSFSGTKTFAVSTFLFETDSGGLTTKIDAGTTTDIWSSNHILAYGPVVRVVSGEIPTTASTSLSSISTSTQSSSGITTPTAAVTTDYVISSSPSLSTGAAVGIGIGCGVAAIALIGTVAIIFVRRRRRRVQSEATTQPANEGDKPQPDYQLQQMYPYELNGEQECPHELHAERESRPHELNAQRE